MLFSRDFSHLHCAQSLLEARFLTLQQEFSKAFRALDDAQAAAFAGDAKGDFGDLTDIRLQAAESLILFAALRADRTRPTHIGLPQTVTAVDQAQSLDDPEAALEVLKAEVKAMLNRAAVTLQQARSTLLSGRPDVERAGLASGCCRPTFSMNSCCSTPGATKLIRSGRLNKRNVRMIPTHRAMARAGSRNCPR